MFIRHDPMVTSDPVCDKAVDTLEPQDFQYFDKDGFELNIAEQKFYKAMGYPIYEPILNHVCWQVTWHTIDDSNCQNRLFLDHSMLLQRCGYVGDARNQIKEFSKNIPQARFLLQVQPKWGFDFDLNAVSPTGVVFEVLHVEYDDYNYDTFLENSEKFDNLVKKIDWLDAADKIWQHRSSWQHLQGYDQNHWKSKFLINWDQAEYTEKSICYGIRQ